MDDVRAPRREASSWVEAAAAGDRAAFGALFDRYAPEVMAVARLHTGDGGRAEQVTADTFVAAWRFAPETDPGIPARTWLLSLATALARDGDAADGRA